MAIKIKEKLQIQRELISENSYEHFRGIIRETKSNKFLHLHKDLQYKSLSFEKENDGEVNLKFQRYQRGAIVYVNFGINLGYELTGHHFAIVLNKDDNPKNGILTVVPLTSKNKGYYIPLNDSITEIVAEEQKKFQDKLANQISKVGKRLIKEDIEGNRLMAELTDLQNDFVTNKKSVKQQLKLIVSTPYYSIRTSRLVRKTMITKKQVDEIKKGQKMLEDALYTYKGNDKKSFAMVKNITTISKFRVIKPANEFDPVGKIHVSNDTLDLLDKALIKFFVK